MPTLTPTQIEIIALCGNDFIDKQIADLTGLSVGGVRWHWRRIFEVFDCHTRAAAVLAYYQSCHLPGNPEPAKFSP